MADYDELYIHMCISKTDLVHQRNNKKKSIKMHRKQKQVRKE